MSDLRLVIFDVDGTLVDSQNHIFMAMEGTYAACGLPAPSRAAVRGIVGLSLPQVFAQLSPDQTPTTQAALIEGYKRAYVTARQSGGVGGGSPLFEGAREVLTLLQGQPNTLLAIATGKSAQGVRHLIQEHALEGVFISTQVADHHPSKPHPSMVLKCLSDAGVTSQQAVMVGDTTYDMDMARAAGVATIGVSWGYHATETLGADHIIDRFDALPAVVDRLLEPTI